MVIQEAGHKPGQEHGRDRGPSDTQVQSKLEADRRIPGADAMPDLEIDSAAIQQYIDDDRRNGETQPTPEESAPGECGRRKEGKEETVKRRRARSTLGHMVLNLDKCGSALWLLVCLVEVLCVVLHDGDAPNQRLFREFSGIGRGRRLWQTPD